MHAISYCHIFAAAAAGIAPAGIAPAAPRPRPRPRLPHLLYLCGHLLHRDPCGD